MANSKKRSRLFYDLQDQKQTVAQLIKQGLGYCCLWAFFTKHKRTGLIAARLGVTERAIRYHKARFRAGENSCEKCTGCLKAKGVI